MSKPITGLYRVIRGVFGPVMDTWVKLEVSGEEHLPSDGAFIIAPNHISNFDPVCMAYFMLTHGYPVRFMAKAELFKVPGLGAVLRSMGMVPVHRSTQHSASVLEDARAALERGECVGIYPEGTLTRDPQMWPMKPKTGAARLALDTGVPVIPIAQWGAHEVMPRYSSRIDFRPGRPIQIIVRPPVDLSDLITEEGSKNREAVQEAAQRIHEEIVAGVSEIRGEKAPARPWDPSAMSGPDKKTLARYARWRRSLAKRSRSYKR
ncbi:MAG: 1-acyl-sn-glycerol-3-phosphate acyltransferase [Actinobacteria bacterium]|nr:MAG: 1-acyl-sn-glycerol-3-phosphate acyltransferase [Actinomycetota bacterium]